MTLARRSVGAGDGLRRHPKPHVDLNRVTALEDVLVQVANLLPGVAAAELLGGDLPEVVVLLDDVPVAAASRSRGSGKALDEVRHRNGLRAAVCRGRAS